MKYLYRILSWLITLLIPIVIVLSVVRLIDTPWYLDFEYRTPGFPADPYGFSLQDRLNYAKITFDYVAKASNISVLADLRFPPGQQAPGPTCQFMTDCTHLYNDRELEHMVDVRNVMHVAMIVLLISFVVLALLAIWAWKGKWQEHYLFGLQRGGILVLVIFGLVIVFFVVAFNYSFVIFHEVFFKAGTWTFLYSDTLIRLFPERFWQDTFIIGGGLSVILGVVIYFITRKMRIRKPITN